MNCTNNFVKSSHDNNPSNFVLSKAPIHFTPYMKLQSETNFSPQKFVEVFPEVKELIHQILFSLYRAKISTEASQTGRLKILVMWEKATYGL